MHGTDPAFPSFDISANNGDGSTHYRVAPGITVRDYFAAHALAALILSRQAEPTCADDASDAYCYADAMIRERAKGTP